MRLRFFGYNAFLIDHEDTRIAIDPGATFLYYLRLTPLIPKTEWPLITHIFVTHGDPDHYWHADRVAEASGAKVICNETMVRRHDGERMVLGPRSKGLTFNARFANLHTVSAGRSLKVDDIDVRTVKTQHGPFKIRIGPFSETVYPGPNERVGWGAIGFVLEVGGRTLVNLGDTLLLRKEWSSIFAPDVLMIPIGGRETHNTMNEDDALEAVAAMRPALTIPCHYNCPALFSRRYNPADAQRFAKGVQALGLECAVMESGDAITLPQSTESTRKVSHLRVVEPSEAPIGH